MLKKLKTIVNMQHGALLCVNGALLCAEEGENS